MKILGILGAFIVTYSNLPQIILFFKQRHAEGISLSSTWLGLVGVSFRTIYLIETTHWDLIALFPYFFAIVCIGITLYFIYFPNKEKTE